jgi:flagellar hook-associated protein 1
MSLVSSLSIAQQALAVNQAAITVVSNNIANVDNENYSKLSVNLSDVVNYTGLTGSTTAQADTLNGVQISKISRASDDYLESYYRSANSKYNYLDEYSTVATNIEDTMNELNDTGLNNALSNFYDAANALADSPTDETARQNYISCAENVCSIFNSTYESLSSQQTDLVGDSNVNGSCDTAEIGQEVSSVNDLLDQLADVNKNIVQTNSETTSASSLLDERDSLLSEISNYIPITTKINDNGTANVSIGSTALVTGSTVKGYLDVTNQNIASTETDAVQINVINPDSKEIIKTDINSSIDSGTIGAILDVTSTDTTSSDLNISSVLSSLNTLASTFASTLNGLQSGSTSTTSGGVTTTTYAMCLSSDYTSLTASTEALFENSADDTTTGITAGNITVNSDLEDKLYLIAAGRTSSSATSTDVGNNSNMTKVSATQTDTYTALSSQSFSDYLATTVSSIGSDVSSLSDNLSTQSDVCDSITSTLSSETGVNLDEELGNLIKFQQAYEAAARVFTTCSDLISELIQLGE